MIVTHGETGFLQSILKDISSVLNTEELELFALQGDASTRRYYRVCEINKPDNSLIVMQLPANPLQCDELCSSQSFRFTELPFSNVARFLGDNGIRVPKIIQNETERGFLLLEDLGDITLGKYLETIDPSQLAEYYKKAIEIIAQIQTLTDKVKKSDCYAGKRLFDYELLFGELIHFLEYGVGTKIGVSVSERDMKVINEGFNFIAKKVASASYVLSLRDFQSRNIMMKNGEYALIDFQDALMASPLYDVVSLTRDSYVDITGLLRELLPFAYRKLKHPFIGFEEFYRFYLFQTLQRKLKDSGRFVFIDRVRKNPSFLRFIPVSLGYVKSAFDELGELEELRRVLVRYRPELGK